VRNKGCEKVGVAKKNTEASSLQNICLAIPNVVLYHLSFNTNISNIVFSGNLEFFPQLQYLILFSIKKYSFVEVDVLILYLKFEFGLLNGAKWI
jgi:hypothetical protein